MNADGTLGGLQTQHFGRSLARLGEIASTIDYAWQWLRRGAPHGAVVIAERQTAGRGRRGRAWASPQGGLWMSVVTRPDLEPEKVGRLGLAIAVAGAEAIAAETGCEVALRWPNDLMVGGNKVGGVLVEAQIAAGSVSEAILSIGVNVNVALLDLPPEVQAMATSVLMVTGRTHLVSAIAARLLEKLEALWPSVEGDGAALGAAWGQRDALAGKEVSVSLAGKVLAGRATGTDHCGRLHLMGAGGEQVVSAGEILSVRELHDAGPQTQVG